MTSQTKDTRLLVAGVVAFLALVVYLGVAFAGTHVSAFQQSAQSKIAPWIPYRSNAVRISRGKEVLAVRMTQVDPGNYGALVPTLVSDPPDGHRFVVGLSFKASSPGRIGVAIDEFRPDATSVYLVNTTVPVTTRWRHFTFQGRIKGTWLGLGMNVYRQAGARVRSRKSSWFAARGPSVTVSRR